MNITRDEVKQVLMILNNEFDGMLKGEPTQDTLKIDMWYMQLQDFSYNQVLQAIKILLSSKVYGKPNVSDLMEILIPTGKQQNLGIEYANDLIDLQKKYGTERMGSYVYDKYGDVGYEIYEQNKRELRELLMSDIPTFKAQIRDVFNSRNERVQIKEQQELLNSTNSLENNANLLEDNENEDND